MARKKKPAEDALIAQVRLGIKELDKLLEKINPKRPQTKSDRTKRRQAARD
jgi:hypothetical protein